MSDSEGTFNTVALMAATLRAGKAGKAGKAWQEAISEAVSGYALMLASQAQIGQMILDATQSAVVSMDEVPPNPPVSH